MRERERRKNKGKKAKKKRRRQQTHSVKASTAPTDAHNSSPPPSPARLNAKGRESTPAPMAELQRVKTDEAEVEPESPPSSSEEEEVGRSPSSSDARRWATSGGDDGGNGGGSGGGGGGPSADRGRGTLIPPPPKPLWPGHEPSPVSLGDSPPLWSPALAKSGESMTSCFPFFLFFGSLSNLCKKKQALFFGIVVIGFFSLSLVSLNFPSFFVFVFLSFV